MLTIGLVANEPSGDVLGAALVRALREREPNARFVGVAGPRMRALGCVSLLPMEQLAVMGLVEVLRVLPQLLGARHRLARYFLDMPPDVFIGIDAPDFNLGLECRLRRAGIPTAHLVCPTVWAWRPGRVKRIRRAADVLLSLFPFEVPFLTRHGVVARYIGHPLADEIEFQVDSAAARQSLGESATGPLIALLPGSRRGEVERLAAPFIETARWCVRQRPELRFIAPLVSPALRECFSAHLARVAPELPVRLLDGQSRAAIAAADLVLTASGTATLEALLLKRPMLVGYRVHGLTYFLIARLNLIKVPFAAMSNLLIGRELAPEFLQDRCRADLMGPALLKMLDDAPGLAERRREYERVHRELRRDAARQAADAILELIGRGARD